MAVHEPLCDPRIVNMCTRQSRQQVNCPRTSHNGVCPKRRERGADECTLWSQGIYVRAYPFGACSECCEGRVLRDDRGADHRCVLHLEELRPQFGWVGEHTDTPASHAVRLGEREARQHVCSGADRQPLPVVHKMSIGVVEVEEAPVARSECNCSLDDRPRQVDSRWVARRAQRHQPDRSRRESGSDSDISALELRFQPIEVRQEVMRYRRPNQD
mmetsp:Transcript_29609/g.67899  ORF Transcript_29609/g.67899 Transcript_29609/m.67899 type:complete len:215 (+) Transcript_29609:302-946(+)